MEAKLLKILLVITLESIEGVIIQAFKMCGGDNDYEDSGVGCCVSDTRQRVKENESGKYVPNKGTR